MKSDQSLAPMENQPWILFYRMGEMLRGQPRAMANYADPTASGRQLDAGRDAEAESQMVDEGCPNP